MSKETNADIVILRALVLYNTVQNTTVQAILEGLYGGRREYDPAKVPAFARV